MADKMIKHNIGAVDEQKKEAFLSALRGGECVPSSYLPTTPSCHFERYTFMHKLGKLGVVYDTKANIFSVSAKSSVLDCVLPLLGVKSAKQPDPPQPAAKQPAPRTQKAGQAAIAGKKAAPQLTSQKAAQPALAGKKAAPQLTSQKTAQPALTTQKAGQAALPQREKVPLLSARPENAQDAPAYKDGFALRKCPPERLEAFVKQIRALRGVGVSSAETPDGVAYTICEKQQKCYLRYAPKKQTLQLQGKRSNLFAQVQVILTGSSGFNEAVGSHQELTGEQKRATNVGRSLKKLLPNAFPLLSEQSRIDLGIGMVDIGNGKVVLSDYSVLLVPPYRGLERFIYDLQQSKGISVKMIGQAYEKDAAGNYLLKAGYRRKVGVVFSEVMSALYAEYFARRNFYAHSDNTDGGVSRFIAEKATAVAIFDNLCKVLDYNACKLKEIGFGMPPPAKDTAR